MPNTQISRDYKVIPSSTLADLVDYVLYGNAYGSGHFLNAVLTNDLVGVFKRGDLANLTALWAIVTWLHNRAPQGCYGSKDAVRQWRDAGGLKGRFPDLTHGEEFKYVEGMKKDTVLE